MIYNDILYRKEPFLVSKKTPIPRKGRTSPIPQRTNVAKDTHHAKGANLLRISYEQRVCETSVKPTPKMPMQICHTPILTYSHTPLLPYSHTPVLVPYSHTPILSSRRRFSLLPELQLSPKRRRSRRAMARHSRASAALMCMHSLQGQLACTDGCLAPFRKHVERLVGVESPSASL